MKTLIVVDMQNDFVTGKLGSEAAKSVVDGIQRKIKAYVEAGDRVIFTRDRHNQQTYARTAEGRSVPPHCMDGTDGVDIINQLKMVPDAKHVFIEDKESFGYRGWRKFNFDEIEIVGICTDICVVTNALMLRSYFPESRISVDASCCAGTTNERHKEALDVMRSCCIDITGEK
jgi:nicotinamidase-related amidase